MLCPHPLLQDRSFLKMNIIEAVKSKKKFRRPHMKVFHEFPHPKADGWYIRYEDLIAEDWEVEEKKVEVNFNSLCSAFNEAKIKFHKETGFSYPSVNAIAKELGLLD